MHHMHLRHSTVDDEDAQHGMHLRRSTVDDEDAQHDMHLHCIRKRRYAASIYFISIDSSAKDVLRIYEVMFSVDLGGISYET